MKIRPFIIVLMLTGFFLADAAFAQALQYRVIYACKSYGEPYEYAVLSCTGEAESSPCAGRIFRDQFGTPVTVVVNETRANASKRIQSCQRTSRMAPDPATQPKQTPAPAAAPPAETPKSAPTGNAQSFIDSGISMLNSARQEANPSKDDKRLAQAIDQFNKALAIDPNSVDAYNGLANAYHDQEQWQMEVSALNRSLALKPDASYFIMLGTVDLRLRQFDGALKAFRGAIAQKSDSATTQQAQWGVGVAYYNLNQFENAIAAMQEAIRQKPDDSYSYFYLGLANYQLRRYAAALAPFQQAVRLDPNTADNQRWLGSTYLMLNQYTNSIAPLKESLRLQPGNEDADFGLGEAYYNLKQYQNALAPLQEAVRIAPNEAVYQYWLGLNYVALGNKDAATQVYKKLQALDAQSAQQLFDAINKVPANSAKPRN